MISDSLIIPGFLTQIHFIPSLTSILDHINSNVKSSKYLLIVDPLVLSLYEKEIKVSEIFQKLVIKPLPQGELNKNIDNYQNFLDCLFTNSFLRNDVVVSLGGGLVGDFSGFVASTYMRGVRFIQIPTTLLSMVDASIGSKTGVNTRFGKNLVGSFYDPLAVYVNTNFLQTLDDRNFCNGMAEVIKAALIEDKKLFEILVTTTFEGLKNNALLLKTVIKTSMSIKINVVKDDRKEADRRAILNFGHTIGHGIEAASQEQLLHGECVAIGMVLEIEALLAKGGIYEEAQANKIIGKIIECLENFNLPTRFPKELVRVENSISYMLTDKKNKESQRVQIIGIEDIGKVFPKSFAVETNFIKAVLSSEVTPSLNRPLSELNSLSSEFILPGSKSITNRALLLSALTKGRTTLRNFVKSDDVLAMLNALVDLQALEILENDEKNSVLIVQGKGGEMKQPEKPLYLREAGTAARFIISACLLLKGRVEITSSDSFKRRPVNDLVMAILSVVKPEDGITIKYLEKPGHLPIEVINDTGTFPGGVIEINGNTSSQFVSSLMLISPFFKNDSKIVIKDAKNELVSEPFILMTVGIMKQFSVNVGRESRSVFTISKGQEYRLSDGEYSIEPDTSTFGFDLLKVVLFGGEIRLNGINPENSLQGDTRFAKDIVSLLGVEVTESKDSLVVRRDFTTQLKADNLEFDMNKYTDCFIVLSLMLSLRPGVRSQIKGISNQRVKECNRIKAVSRNLNKLGILCQETEDGLIVHGINNKIACRGTVKIKTYNDHRMAMAFGIFTTFLKEVFFKHDEQTNFIIDNKHCVQKTFPGFWSHISKQYSIASLTPNNAPREDLDHPIFIIGMRGCGKTTYGKTTAENFGWNFIDLDEEISKELVSSHGLNSISEAVEKRGWDFFRNLESSLLHSIVGDFYEGKRRAQTVCSLGGGVIERKENRELLGFQRNVVYFDAMFYERSKNDDPLVGRPSYANESYFECYERRKPLYEEVATYILTIPSKSNIESKNIKPFGVVGEKEYRDCVWRNVIKKFMKKLIMKDDHRFTPPQFHSEQIYVVSLFAEEFRKFEAPDYLVLTKKYNAIEIRFDKLLDEGYTMNQEAKVFEEIRKELAILNYHAPRLPVVFTVRSKSEGGFFPSDQKLLASIYKNISKTLIPQYYDIELSHHRLALQILERQPFNRYILSRHYLNKCSEENVLKDLEKMNSILANLDSKKSGSVLKLILSSQHSEELVHKARSLCKAFAYPTAVFRLGRDGRLSRITNNTLNYVYDPKHSGPAAVGQLSREELVALKASVLDLSPKRFYIIGTEISESLSPRIHNYLFDLNNLSATHHYGRAKACSVEEVLAILENGDGASITVPYKKTVIPHVDYLVDEAESMKVVNTIVKRNGKLWGYNTDWYGIYQPLKKRFIRNESRSQENSIGIIIGAGATGETAIYALRRLGLKVLLWNRSSERLEDLGLLKNEVDKFFIDSEGRLNELEEYVQKEASEKNVKISCIISALPPGSSISFSEKLFEHKPVFFQVNYFSNETEIMKKAVESGCPIVLGLEMLLYQAIGQNRIFSGRSSSKRMLFEHFRDLLSVE